MRESKTVKIQLDTSVDGKVIEKEFTVKELSIRSIIQLSKNNAFFNDSKDIEKEPKQAPISTSKLIPTPDIKKDENGEKPEDSAEEKSLYTELTDIGTDINKIMEETCDFKMEDLMELYPSDVKKLYEAFQEVNQTFLDVLRKLKILEMFQSVMERTFNNFSGMLAI